MTLPRDANYVPVSGGVSNADGLTVLPFRVDPITGRLLVSATGASGSGTVTDFSFTNANGIAGVVTNSTTTPNLTLSLGAIVPTTVNGVTLSGASSPALVVTGAASVSGANTGNQNLFSTVAVAGQSSIVVDGPTNTLTFEPGAGITILTIPGTKTVSIIATADVHGGGSSTDKALARWNGTGGTAIQNSVGTLSDAGVLNVASYLRGSTVVTNQSSYTVGASVLVADFTTIQAALDAVGASGGTIFIQDGTYTITTGLLWKVSNTTVVCSGGVVIQNNGTTVPTAIKSATVLSKLSRQKWRGGKFLQTLAPGSTVGDCFDASDMADCDFKPTRIEGYDRGLVVNDNNTGADSFTFYNSYGPTQIFDCNTCVSVGVESTSTQPNNNRFVSLRCRPKAGGAGYGLRVADARGLTFDTCDFEPSSATGITGISLEANATSGGFAREVTFVNCWVEGNAVGVSAVNGVSRVKFVGSSVTSNTVDIVDATASGIMWDVTNKTGTTISRAALSAPLLGGNFSPLTVSVTDTTNNQRAVVVTNSGTGNSLLVTPTGNAGSSTQTGGVGTLSGAIVLDNTGNAGAGIQVYSNNATLTSLGLLYVANDNASSGNPLVTFSHSGGGASANALRLVMAGNTGSSDASSGALFVDSRLNSGYGVNVLGSNDVVTQDLLRVNVGAPNQTTVSGSQTLSTSSTSLTVADTTGFPSSGTILIFGSSGVTENQPSRYVVYTGKTSTTFTGVAGTFYRQAASFALSNGWLIWGMGTSALNNMVVGHFIDTATNGGVANIKVTSPNPDIEIVGRGFNGAIGEGKFEMDVPFAGSSSNPASVDCFRVNGRTDANAGFDTIAIFTRPGVANQGKVGIGFQNKTGPVSIAAHLHVVNSDTFGDTGAASLIAGIYQGFTGQIADLLQTRTYAGAVLNAFDAGARLVLGETTSPSATVGFGKLYAKSSDSALYYMTGAGTETLVSGGGDMAKATYDPANVSQQLVGLTATQTLTGKTLTSAKITTNLAPTANDGAALGTTALSFSDLFLAAGGVLNWNAGALTLTGSSSNYFQLAGGGLRVIGNGVGINVGNSPSVALDIVSDATLTQGVRITSDGATRLGFSVLVSADTNPRGTFRADGLIGWGSGSSPTDTTLYRSAANELTTDGNLKLGTPGTAANSVATVDAAQTLSSKRVAPRVVTVASSANPAINTDATDVYVLSALAVAVTSFTTNLTGTPTGGEGLRVEITDNGTARALAWGASFEASGTVALPTTTVLGVKLTVQFYWNAATSKWRAAWAS